MKKAYLLKAKEVNLLKNASKCLLDALFDPKEDTFGMFLRRQKMKSHLWRYGQSRKWSFRKGEKGWKALR